MKRLYFDIEKCLGCRTCEFACAMAHSVTKDLFKMLREKDKSLPRIKIAFAKDENYPVACRHCDDPKCVDACMSAALSKDPVSGQVMYNKDKCVGCWMCVMVCPYGAIRPDKNVKIAIRCDLCIDVGEPQCVKSCPVKAITWAEEEDQMKPRLSEQSEAKSSG